MSTDINLTIKEYIVSIGKNNVQYQIKTEEILPWLKELEEMTGGKKKWRTLSFNNLNCIWLKYIRFYKLFDYWIVCNRDNKPIDWKSCNINTLNKE